MIPKMGTSVRLRRCGSRQRCASDLAEALQAEFENRSNAAKTLMRWTGVSNRGARYWLSGERCPNGWQLILLARHSDAVLRAILQMCGRPAFELALDLDALRLALTQAVKTLDAIEAGMIQERPKKAGQRSGSAARRRKGEGTDPQGNLRGPIGGATR